MKLGQAQVTRVQDKPTHACQRAEVLLALVGICLKMEKLQASAEAREVFREVAADLKAMQAQAWKNEKRR